jgi:hypothetical protein
MEQKGGVFSYHRPYSSEHVRAIEVSRKLRQSELAKQPELEELPTEREVRAYIHEQGLDTAEQRLLHERDLLNQLDEAVWLQDEPLIKQLRQRIWMISNHIHNTLEIPSDTIEQAAHEETVRAIKAPMEHRGDADEINSSVTQHEDEKQLWASILGVLRQHLTGDELMRALQAQDENETEKTVYNPLQDFEQRYKTVLEQATHYRGSQRKDAEPRLRKLRMIRDRLYYNILFPQQAALAYRAERNWKREHRRPT